MSECKTCQDDLDSGVILLLGQRTREEAGRKRFEEKIGTYGYAEQSRNGATAEC